MVSPTGLYILVSILIWATMFLVGTNAKVNRKIRLIVFYIGGMSFGIHVNIAEGGGMIEDFGLPDTGFIYGFAFIAFLVHLLMIWIVSQSLNTDNP